MDILAVADIYAAVADVAALIVEAEYVAGFKGIQLHMYTVVSLGSGRAVERVAELLIHIVYKAGAVKTGFRALFSVDIFISHILAGKISYILA